jgi:hypothetical protein
MYGHWTHRDPVICEFQHGATMIYISYNEKNPMENRLAVAQKTIDAVFEEMDHALAFAAKISAERHPEFWRNASRITLKQKPLIAFSIRYLLNSDFPVYEISWNPLFQPESGEAYSEDWIEEPVYVELPDDNDFIELQRIGSCQYQHMA